MLDMVTIGAGGGSIARVGGASRDGRAAQRGRRAEASLLRPGRDGADRDRRTLPGHLPPSLLGGRMTLTPALAKLRCGGWPPRG